MVYLSKDKRIQYKQDKGIITEYHTGLNDPIVPSQGNGSGGVGHRPDLPPTRMTPGREEMGPSDRRALSLSTNGRLDNPRSTGSDTGAVRPKDHRESGADPRITSNP